MADGASGFAGAADSAGSAEAADSAEPADDAVLPIQVRLGFVDPNAAARFLRAASGGEGLDSARRTGS
ncbi:hypothetical protein CIK81_17860 [Brachybacterium sp. JB7]|nr:hypothetical protein CIK81_17860 [Brachybacterium sp. JB7]